MRASRGEEALLIDGLGDVDGISLLCGSVGTQTSNDIVGLTQTQLMMPQIPPPAMTAKGEVGELPRALPRICFALS